MPWLQKKSKDSTSATTHAKPYWYIRVPTGHGYKALNTGTNDKKTAKRMEVMIDNLYRGKRRDHDLLAWLLDRKLPPVERLKPLTLLTHYESNTLDDLKAERASKLQAEDAPAVVNVNDYVDAWHKNVATRSSSDNATRFLSAVRTFVPEGEIVSPDRFSHATLLDWANSLQDPEADEGLGLSAETARRYRAGLFNFIEHLVDLEILPTNRLARIAAPKKGKPRDRHLTTRDVHRLIAAFADRTNEPLQRFIAERDIDVCELQGYNALLQGAGVEVSVGLNVTAKDFREEDKEVRAPGTKTYNRDRVVRVAEWALPFVTACAKGRAPHEKLFATIPNRWVANEAFNLAIAPLVAAEPAIFDNYWMRDARHTYAVRAIRAGTPPDVVARQLGHKDATLVLKVYGVYAPKSSERNHWEENTAKHDEKTGQLTEAVAVLPRRARRESGTSSQPVSRRATKIEWPSKEELLRRLATASAVTISKELGVSDVALRKHLQRQGVARLPDGRRGNVSRARPSRVS
jgi:integrase